MARRQRFYRPPASSYLHICRYCNERRSRVPTPDAGRADPCLAGRCICQFCQSGLKRGRGDSNPQTLSGHLFSGQAACSISTHPRIAPQIGLEPTCRYHRPTVFQAAPPPIEGLRRKVDRVGFEPTVPGGNGFTIRLLSQFAYLPISFLS